MVAMVGSIILLVRGLGQDGDGKVSASELRACMAAARLSKEEAAAIFAAADADGDGLLDQEEFLSLARDAEDEDDDDNSDSCLREAFAMYRAEGEDEITPASLRRMLTQLGDELVVGMEECRAMIRRFDLNGDGVLSFHEFRVMMHDGPM